MKRLLGFVFLLISCDSISQNICETNGNLAVFSNYDGGILTINVDQNIPNLKIGICTSEPVQVSFTGPFVGNITQVIYAGFNSTQNNNNCGLGNFPTSVSGVTSNLVIIETAPPVGYIPAHGNGAGPWGAIMIGASGQCDTMTNAGGANTPDEIVYYFQQQTGGNLLFHKTQYQCWLNETVNVSDGGNCCILPPEQCGLVATTSVIPNSVCQPCNYSGPSILINELMVSPTSNDGSLSGNGGVSQGRGEWIELFNPNWCDSVDISCYYLGNSAPGSSAFSGTQSGGYVIPEGTIIPPLGLALIRGINTAPVPVNLLIQNGGNVVELIVPGNLPSPGICVGSGASRLWFPNSGGWFAFYNAQGVPQDAVSWGDGGSPADKNGNPCIAQAALCNFSGTLSSYNQIPSNLKQQVTTVNAETHQGQSIRRLPDGGSWSNFGSPSYGTCNDPANCDVFSGVSQCNGSATVNVTSGVEPYSFQWDDPLNQVTQTAVNLCEGIYNVVVTDANACSETYEVNVITNPFSIIAAIVQPACLQSNGSISLNPFNANYNYAWSPNVSVTNSASNLAQGSYTITVSDGSCSFDTTIVLQNPTPFTATLVTENTTCGQNNGTINLNINPPGNYTYSWTPNVSTNQSANSLIPGNYSINISDNVCETTLIANIASSIPITSNVEVLNTSCNQANGAIWIDLSPTSNYSFTWSPSVSTIDSAINIASGTYQIQFTDGVCSGDTTLIVAPSQAPSAISYNVIPTNCGTDNGSISITQVTGGQSPYSYSFNGQQSFGNNSDTFNLANQNYQIAVKDLNNCIYEEQITISEIPGPNALLSQLQNPTCGTNNGAIFLLGAIGGAPPYFYQFNGQAMNDTAILNLSAATYSVEVSDAYGCSYQQDLSLISAAGNSTVFIPNVFTPNNDNQSTNEFWKVEATCIKAIEGKILNRWGDKVFEFDELSDSWDGKTKSGEQVKDGVYFYKVELTYFDDSSEIFHGHITVVR